jgi:hypothetical protein
VLPDLSDALALLSRLLAQEPSLAADLISQSVAVGPPPRAAPAFAPGAAFAARGGKAAFAAPAATRTWLDVASGVLALARPLALRLPPAAALRLLSDAARLLGCLADAAPGAVAALLPALPLLAAPGLGPGGPLAGLPACVPFEALPSFTVPQVHPCLRFSRAPSCRLFTAVRHPSIRGP